MITRRKDTDLQKTSETVVNEARQKAAGNPRWLNVVDQAIEGPMGNWIVTEILDVLKFGESLDA
jgi:hypothetical protein